MAGEPESVDVTSVGTVVVFNRGADVFSADSVLLRVSVVKRKDCRSVLAKLGIDDDRTPAGFEDGNNEEVDADAADDDDDEEEVEEVEEEGNNEEEEVEAAISCALLDRLGVEGWMRRSSALAGVAGFSARMSGSAAEESEASSMKEFKSEKVFR